MAETELLPTDIVEKGRAHLKVAWSDSIYDLLKGKGLLEQALDEIERLRRAPVAEGSAGKDEGLSIERGDSEVLSSSNTEGERE